MHPRMAVSFGNGEHVSSLVYVAIGTGIGGGAIQNGEFIGGISHGRSHMIVKPYGDSLKRKLPIHDYCLEVLQVDRPFNIGRV